MCHDPITFTGDRAPGALEWQQLVRCAALSPSKAEGHTDAIASGAPPGGLCLPTTSIQFIVALGARAALSFSSEH